MVFTLIVFLLVVVFLACFIGFNLNNICPSLWLFKNFTNINAAILVLIAFGAGIVFSLLLLMIAKFKSSVASSAVAESKAKEAKAEKSEKRVKTEKKIKKLSKKDKKAGVVTPSESSSDPTIIADK